VSAEQQYFPMPVVGLTPVPLAHANALLERWGHYLGPVNRPFGSQAWVLDVTGEPCSVAVSCSAVSETAAGLKRAEVVELARLCSDPQQRWATRPMLRLWREVAAPRWPYWPVTAAIAYSQNARHGGEIYRFDGWKKVSESGGSSGGGTWTAPRRPGDATARAQDALAVAVRDQRGGDRCALTPQ